MVDCWRYEGILVTGNASRSPSTEVRRRENPLLLPQHFPVGDSQRFNQEWCSGREKQEMKRAVLAVLCLAVVIGS